MEGCDSGYIGSLCVQSKNFIISKTYYPYSYTLTLYTHTHPFIHVIDIHNNIYFKNKYYSVILQRFCKLNIEKNKNLQKKTTNNLKHLKKDKCYNINKNIIYSL